MIVYHGTVLEIKRPDVSLSRKNIDFGVGFYVTTYQDQAEKWAVRKALRTFKQPIVNEYEVGSLSQYRIKRFGDPDPEWLHFVCDCRNGLDVYKDYDVIIGSVANDEVMKCVRMYMRGIWDEKRTLEEIVYYERNDQMAIINQNIIDEAFHFVGTYEVNR